MNLQLDHAEHIASVQPWPRRDDLVDVIELMCDLLREAEEDHEWERRFVNEQHQRELDVAYTAGWREGQIALGLQWPALRKRDAVEEAYRAGVHAGLQAARLAAERGVEQAMGVAS